MPVVGRDRLLKDITDTLHRSDIANQASRRHILDNKMGNCPHCSHDKYVRFGIDRGPQPGQTHLKMIVNLLKKSYLRFSLGILCQMLQRIKK